MGRGQNNQANGLNLLFGSREQAALIKNQSAAQKAALLTRRNQIHQQKDLLFDRLEANPAEFKGQQSILQGRVIEKFTHTVEAKSIQVGPDNGVFESAPQEEIYDPIKEVHSRTLVSRGMDIIFAIDSSSDRPFVAGIYNHDTQDLTTNSYSDIRKTISGLWFSLHHFGEQEPDFRENFHDADAAEHYLETEIILALGLEANLDENKPGS